MSNAIWLLQTEFINHVVFALKKLLQGRPHGGCGIFTCTSFPCISNTSIDGYSTSSEIANCFASKYKHLLNSVLTKNDEMHILYNTVCYEQRENCKYNIEGHCHGITYILFLNRLIS